MPKEEFLHTNQANVYSRLFLHCSVNSNTDFWSFFSIFFKECFETKEVPGYDSLLEKLTMQMIMVGLANPNNPCKQEEPIFYVVGGVL